MQGGESIIIKVFERKDTENTSEKPPDTAGDDPGTRSSSGYG
jgi:hypothetical protein